MKVTSSVFGHLKETFLHFVHYNSVPEDIEMIFYAISHQRCHIWTLGKTHSLPVHHCIGKVGSVFMTHLNQRKIDETMKKKTKQHYFRYCFFVIIRPDLLEVCLCLAARDCYQTVISAGCLVGAFLMILSFLTGTNENVNFSPSQSRRQPVSQSAHPTGPTTSS